MKTKLSAKFKEPAKKMPPLRHSVSKPFDIRKSEVAKWLCSQPEIMQYVFEKANSNGLIKYDQEANLWTGTDFKEEEAGK